MPASMVRVVGASARAAVYSLARAGLAGSSIDLFGDRDLTRLATTLLCQLQDYPEAFPGLVERLPHGPIMYTGGLENHPDVVARLARAGPLWGNHPGVLTRVRDPFWLDGAIPRGIGKARLIASGEPAPGAGQWLRKPLRSCGGRGIRLASAGEAASQQHYFQEWMVGRSLSAQFVTDNRDETRTRLLGVAEQLIGASWLHAPSFAYCGNIGPVDLSHDIEAAILMLGSTLAQSAGLCGLWGLDFILNGTQIHPLEINPRYTAAMEVLELAVGFSCLQPHCDSFAPNGGAWPHDWALPDLQASPCHRAPSPYGRSMVGKAIYYAPHRILFPNSGPWDDDLSRPIDVWRVPAYADIPHAGARIEPGSPVLTIFRAGSSCATCREGLQSAAAELDRLWEARYDTQ